jgi:lysophospholipase L1-like esterase
MNSAAASSASAAVQEVQRSSRGLTLALFVSLLVALSLIAFLWLTARHYALAQEAVRLDPIGLKVYASERGKSFDGPILVFFGDSRAVMWPPPPGLTRYRVLNRGIGFQTTAQILLRLDDDVLRLRPAVVVFEGGINDLKSIADFPERRAEIVADCEANLEHIVKGCEQVGAKVVLVTIFAVGDVALWRRPFWSSQVSAAAREVNAFLSRLAGPNVVLLDADSVLTDGRGDILSAYQLDYLHLKPAGYEKLNETLLPAVSAIRP